MSIQNRGLRAADWVGRLMISGIFIAAGIDKIRHRESTKRYMQSKSMPMVPVMLTGAVVMELGLAPALALGLAPRFVAPMLAFFLVPTSLNFHDFWTMEGQDKKAQSVNFFKNVAIVGGLIAIALRDYESSVQARAFEGQDQSGLRRPDYLDQVQQEVV